MNDVIRDAYSALRSVTPLPHGMDCGLLCGAACCRGTDDDGMELFHGEEARFLHDPDFTIRTDGTRRLLICRGTCDRHSRPLACRIFPFYPVPTDTAHGVGIRVMYDMRALRTCPVVRDRLRPDPRFVHGVRMAGLILARDPENLRIMRETAALFDDIRDLSSML